MVTSLSPNQYKIFVMKKVILLFAAIFGVHQFIVAQDLEAKQKKDKWGYVKKENPKKFVIKAKFNEAYPFGKFLDSNRAFVRSAGSIGVIDKKGKWLIKPTYDTIFEQKKLNEIFLFAKKDKETFLLNKQGEIISEAFSSLEPLNKEVFIFSKNKQLGLMLRKNQKYETILPATYDNLGVVNFDNTLFYVRKEGKVKFYDLLTKKFSEEYDKYNSIKKRDTGEIRHTKTYLVVEKNKQKGLIDEKMNLIIALEYDQINQFRTNQNNETLFEVSKKGKKGLINQYGKSVLDTEFDAIYYNNTYLIATKNSLLGCYDLQGKQILNHLYEDIRFWKEQNLFLVSREKLYGLVSTEEKIVLPILHTDLTRLNYDKLCYVVSTKDKKKSILALENNTSEKIHKEDFEDVRFLGTQPLEVIIRSKSKENVYRIDNKKIQKVYKKDYDKIEKFNKNYYLVIDKAKKYFLDIQSEKLIALPEYTLLKDGNELYQAGKREKKKYAEGQEEGTFYLEQGEKAFFWNINTQKLVLTDKINPFDTSTTKKMKPTIQPKKDTKPKKTRKK